jgi:hypothetical protein
LAFSYWIDYLGFITEGKLAAIFIKPSLGVSNWPVMYYTFPRQLGNISFLSLLPRLKKKFPHHHHRAINKAGGTWAGGWADRTSLSRRASAVLGCQFSSRCWATRWLGGWAARHRPRLIWAGPSGAGWSGTFLGRSVTRIEHRS